MLLTAEYLRDVFRTAVTQIEVPDKYEVLLEGSIAEGFGNDGSDIDYLVVTEGDAEHLTMPTVLFIEDRRVEIRMRSAQQVRDQITALAEAAQRGPHRVTDDLLNRCQRFINGYPLAAGPIVHDLQLILPATGLADVAGKWFCYHAEQAFWLAAAVRTLNEPDYATLYQRIALLRGVKSWLCARGETYLDAKWLGAQLARVPDGAEIESEHRRLSAPSTSPQAVAEFLTSLGVKVAFRPDLIELRRRRQVTTWPLGSRVHVLRNRADLFALSPHATRVWRSLAFGAPLDEVVAKGDPGTGPLLAQFHRLGLVELGRRGGPVLPGAGSLTPELRVTTPILGLEGSPVPEHTDILLIPVPARRYAASGMALVWSNLGVENAKEDLLGALAQDQWTTATTAALRLVRSACLAVLDAYATQPRPPIEEAPLRLERMAELPKQFRASAARLVEVLQTEGFAAVEGGVAELEAFVEETRRVTRCEFPGTFDSSAAWSDTLGIGHDWVRLGSHLDSDFPVAEARDLLASHGQASPRTAREGSAA